MNVNVTVTYNESDEQKSPTLIAAVVLEALGGDPEKDSCFVSVSSSAAIAPPPPEPQPLPV